LGHDATLGLDTERERGDVDEQNVLALALQHASLECSADSDDLVRVDALVRVLATGLLLDQVVDGWHTGRSTDENDVCDVVDRNTGLADDVLERLLRAVDEVARHLLELCAGERLVEVCRAVLREGEVRQL